ncbi:alpha/beta hydrolase [Algibacter sp.]|nr:alpha/beta hydrolase [Algibacter sp.]
MIFNKITFPLLALFILASCNGQENGTAASKDVIYKVVNNDSLMLRVYYPKKFNNKKQYPTIVFFFGGGWNGGKISQFEDQSKYFASRGMVAAVVDYRVKSRQGTTPFESVKDAKSAMRFLKNHAKEYGIDTEKMVAAGGSAGGHLAAATTLLPGLNEATDDLSVSPKANALVLYNPVVDNSEEGYGYERVGDRYLEISPMHNIAKGAPPTLFLLGSKDKLIPVSTAYKYQEKMEAVGSECEVIIYEGQEHGFFNQWKKEGPKYYKESNIAADKFLQSLGYLKGEATLK